MKTKLPPLPKTGERRLLKFIPFRDKKLLQVEELLAKPKLNHEELHKLALLTKEAA